MAATEAQIRELAGVIAQQAEGIADGQWQGPLYGAVARLANNVDTLRAWASDDRS